MAGQLVATGNRGGRRASLILLILYFSKWWTVDYLINLVMMVGSPLAGVIAGRVGRRRVIATGLAVYTAGLWLLSDVGSASTVPWGVLVPLAVVATGMAMFTAPLAVATLSGLDEADQGIASGVNNATGQLAGWLAIIVLPALAGLAGAGCLGGAVHGPAYRVDGGPDPTCRASCLPGPVDRGNADHQRSTVGRSHTLDGRRDLLFRGVGPSNPAEVEPQGAGSNALERELSKATERAAMCRYLPQGVVPADDAAAVRTDAPVLWLVGDGDPQDPPANLAALPVQQ